MIGFGRHIAIIRRALKDERTREKGRMRMREPDFLPAALEVVERPVSPTGRITAWVLLIGLVVLIAWLVFGRVDIVVSAPGRIIPTGNVKLVQASATGVVRRIYVADGDTVRAGQPLIDLDPTVSTAEEQEAVKALAAAELDIARNRAIADALAGAPIRFVAPPGTPAAMAALQRQLIEAQVRTTRAEIAGLSAARSAASAEATGAADQIRKYDETIPILAKEVAAMHALAAKGYAPGLRLMELERQHRSERGDRDQSAAMRDKSRSDALRYGAQLGQSLAQARQTALDALAKAQNEAILRREEVTKARRLNHLQRLVAPTAGTIQQLAVHTVGGVVEPVSTLMVVVPDSALSVEARVANRDAGFVRVGQVVAVKLEAFSFTRYGTIPGRVLSINHDAIQDKDSGAYYLARIRLDRSTIVADGGVIPLTAGLDTTSDIRIGSRRIIQFLISPISETGAEAAREK